MLKKQAKKLFELLYIILPILEIQCKTKSFNVHNKCFHVNAQSCHVKCFMNIRQTSS